MFCLVRRHPQEREIVATKLPLLLVGLLAESLLDRTSNEEAANIIRTQAITIALKLDLGTIHTFMARLVRLVTGKIFQQAFGFLLDGS